MPSQTFASQICEINAIFPPISPPFPGLPGLPASEHCPSGSCRLLSAVLRLPPKLLKVLHSQLLQLARRMKGSAHPLPDKLMSCMHKYIYSYEQKNVCQEPPGRRRNAFPTACQRFIVVIYFLPPSKQLLAAPLISRSSKLIYLFIF